MSTNVELLASVPLFSLTDSEERAALASLLQPRGLRTGETVFHQGEPGDELFLVREGRVQVFTTTDTGERIVLGQYGPGDVFGEISLFDGGPRTATAVGAEDSQLVVLDRESLFKLLRQHPHIAIDLLTVMGARLRGTDLLLRAHAVRNVNEQADEHITFGQRIADRVAAFGGSWTFIISFAAFLIIWVTINTILLAQRAFDPYPFILLNLFLSMIAALQAPVIMMSQNRQAMKDRLKVDLDYEVNLRAELEVAQLHRKMDHLLERIESTIIRRSGETTPPAATGR